MHIFSEPTHVFLSVEQRRRLERMAAREGRSVASVIRAAIDSYTTASRSRAEAAEAIIAMDLPVGDWEQMKAEIIAGATEGGA